jgi:hypothetical protein
MIQAPNALVGRASRHRDGSGDFRGYVDVSRPLLRREPIVSAHPAIVPSPGPVADRSTGLT